jgi:cytochrome c553
VLIKQMSDVQAGRRSNPKMLPFADRHVLSAQDIADIAAYLKALPVPAENGRGSGQNLAAATKRYADDCAECHGSAGEGDAGRFYPRVQGQHYRYLLRELVEIRDGVRRNADPRMAEVVRPRSDAELDALADYMSRLPPIAAR